MGSELVDLVKKDEEISRVALVTRRVPGNSMWEQKNFKPKLKVIVKENFNDLHDLHH